MHAVPPVAPVAPASASRPQASPFQAGLVVGGRYRLRAPIGRGAMGEVWLAEHATLGTRLALKLVDPARHPDPAALLARFHREARSAAALRSPHIVRIHDHGVDATDPARPVAFMAMELLEGEGLERRLGARGRLHPSEVAALVVGMAHAVDCAHAAGIVHRDLKPSNVFLAWDEGAPLQTSPPALRSEIVKVLDFGIAKPMQANVDVQLETQMGVVMGTPAYMSPEQVLGAGVGPRSDLWQIGVVAFECMVGRRPFEGQALGQLFQRICTERPPVPSSLAPVPRGFDGWFARAVDHDPDARFGSGAELADAFCAAVGEPLPAFVAPELSTVTGSRAWAAAKREHAPRRRGRAALFAGGMLLPAALAIGAWLVRGGVGEDARAAAGHETSATPPEATRSAGSHVVAAPSAPEPSSEPTAAAPTASGSAAASAAAAASAKPGPVPRTSPRGRRPGRPTSTADPIGL